MMVLMKVWPKKKKELREISVFLGYFLIVWTGDAAVDVSWRWIRIEKETAAGPQSKRETLTDLCG